MSQRLDMYLSANIYKKFIIINLKCFFYYNIYNLIL